MEKLVEYGLETFGVDISNEEELGEYFMIHKDKSSFIVEGLYQAYKILKGE